MAFVFANRGKYHFINAAISAATDLRCGVFTNAVIPADASIQDMNFVSELLSSGTGTAVEAAVAGYARQDLANFTVTEDDTGDEVDIQADAPNFAGANIAAGETWAGVFYYIEDATDTARTLIGVDKPAATLTTNGSTVTLPQFVATVS